MLPPALPSPRQVETSPHRANSTAAETGSVASAWRSTGSAHGNPDDRSAALTASRAFPSPPRPASRCAASRPQESAHAAPNRS